MLYIFDFDYTLFNSIKFKQDFFELFRGLLHDPSNLRLEYFQENKIHYDLEKHFDILGDNLKDRDQASLVLKEFLSDLKKYLFPEVEKLLIKLKNDGHRLILISLGNVDWQKAKIYGSDLEKFFDKVIFTDGPKELALKEADLIKGEEVIIVNDNFNESVEMMKYIENCKLFLIQGPYSENNQNFRINKLDNLLNFK